MRSHRSDNLSNNMEPLRDFFWKQWKIIHIQQTVREGSNVSWKLLKYGIGLVQKYGSQSYSDYITSSWTLTLKLLTFIVRHEQETLNLLAKDLSWWKAHVLFTGLPNNFTVSWLTPCNGSCSATVTVSCDKGTDMVFHASFIHVGWGRVQGVWLARSLTVCSGTWIVHFLLFIWQTINLWKLYEELCGF